MIFFETVKKDNLTIVSEELENNLNTLNKEFINRTIFSESSDFAFLNEAIDIKALKTKIKNKISQLWNSFINWIRDIFKRMNNMLNNIKNRKKLNSSKEQQKVSDTNHPSELKKEFVKKEESKKEQVKKEEPIIKKSYGGQKEESKKEQVKKEEPVIKKSYGGQKEESKKEITITKNDEGKKVYTEKRNYGENITVTRTRTEDELPVEIDNKALRNNFSEVILKSYQIKSIMRTNDVDDVKEYLDELESVYEKYKNMTSKTTFNKAYAIKTLEESMNFSKGCLKSSEDAYKTLESLEVNDENVNLINVKMQLFVKLIHINREIISNVSTAISNLGK